MKKVIAIFGVLAFTAGMAFSQNNVADVDQEGGNQTSTVTQSGSTNNADVNQFTDNFGPQTSDVIQTGVGNIVEVSQSQTGGGDKVLNSAFIQQIGERNYGKQVEVAPGSNSGQHLTAYQTGDDNISEQSILGGHTESFYVQQVGNQNEAYQTALGGSHNHGIIYQTGNLNNAIQTLDGSNNGYSSADVRIDQIGNSNTADQDFWGFGSSHKNNGVIYQFGDNNTASQIADGRELDLQINQEGEDNTASQEATGNNYGLDVGLLDIDQIGNDNNATQFASGNGIEGIILQTGDLNIATMSQTGDFNGATITQIGNSNTATVTQQMAP